MNLPNSITLSRIASVPLLIWIMSPYGLHALGDHHATHGLLGGEQEIAASLIFIAASITDGLDGYLARRRKQITTMGMLLDPLADKLMVATAYILLVAYTPHLVPPWIAVVVIGREFLVSGLRSIASAEGFTIEASEIGKLKTVIQIVSVVAALLAHRWNYWNWGRLHRRRPLHRPHIHLLDDRCLHHLRHRLLRRLLEEDRPRQRHTPRSTQRYPEPPQSLAIQVAAYEDAISRWLKSSWPLSSPALTPSNAEKPAPPSKVEQAFPGQAPEKKTTGW